MIESCGIFLFIGREFLVCHPTNSPWNVLTIPKGLLETGEDRVATAVRELQEETGVVISESEAKLVGSYRYSKQSKILHAFVARIQSKPLELSCSSMVQAKGRQFPEVDDFRWIGPENSSMLHHTQQEALKEILRIGI